MIDGEQRLTTLQILLDAVQIKCRSEGERAAVIVVSEGLERIE